MKALLYRVRRFKKHPAGVVGELQIATVSTMLNNAPYLYESMEELMKDQREEKVWKHLAYTLEPAIPSFYGDKMQKPAAIPEGLYELCKRYSCKFRGDRWFLLNVPHFEGIMFHVGNFPKDTQGCILLGDERKGAAVLKSKLADERVRRSMNRVKNYGAAQFVKIVNDF